MKPTYDTLIKELQSLLDSICYLAPEEFDNEEHKHTFNAEIERVQALIDSTNKGQ